jgi:hypothetical protein
MKKSGHGWQVVLLEEMRGACKVLVGKSDGKRTVGTPSVV